MYHNTNEKSKFKLMTKTQKCGQIKQKEKNEKQYTKG
jgi:hypothetical protein